MSDSGKTPPKSLFTRSSKLLGLASSLAQKEMKGRLSSLIKKGETILDGAQEAKVRIEQARKLVEELGKLKGAAMKAGQMIAQEIRDYLPEEAKLVLEKLQDSGEPAPFSVIEAILKRELGQARFEKLQSLEATPLASASIGQVHRTRLPGADGGMRDAVLKVQFDGIAESIETDLELFRKVSGVMMGLARKSGDLNPLFEELKSVLLLETDYEAELSNMMKYRSFVDADPELSNGLMIPRPFPDFTTKKVLALEYIEALRFEDWLKTNPPLDHRQWVGEKLLELHFQEFYFWGFVQTDPNFGNFLIKTASLSTDRPLLVLLDFGSVKTYTEDFRKNYIRLIKAMIDRRESEILEIVFELGLLSPDESEATYSLFLELLYHSASIFDPEQQPFDFNDDHYDRASTQKSMEFIRALKHSSPPRDLIFLNRKLAGIYRMLRRLGAKIDLNPYLNRLQEL